MIGYLLSTITSRVSLPLLTKQKFLYSFNISFLIRKAEKIQRKNFSSQILTKNDNIQLAKDVIVFNYENPKMFRFLNFFAISQLFFWGYLGNWAYSEMKFTKVSNILIISKINILQEFFLGRSC